VSGLSRKKKSVETVKQGLGREAVQGSTGGDRWKKGKKAPVVGSKGGGGKKTNQRTHRMSKGGDRNRGLEVGTVVSSWKGGKKILETTEPG